MYSYQHKYHAGNFADLHKHISLIAILKYLHRKSSPFCAIDLFAGDGLYDLSCIEAQKNQEYLTGYNLLDQLTTKQSQDALQPNLFKDLLDITPENIYPGSPKIIESFLREQDRGIFVENHPQAFSSLSSNFKKRANIKTYKRNAYEALSSFISYPETRGLVLVDPSYEVKNEYQDIAELILKAYARKPTTIYIVWYPILANKKSHQKLTPIFNSINSNDIWHHQLYLQSDFKSSDYGMVGSGIIIINPPWTVDQTLEQHFEQVKTLI